MADSGNQWLRVVFRHYARYLYSRGEISHQSLHRILTRVPGRRVSREPRNSVVDYDALRGTLMFLLEKHGCTISLYRVLLGSGLRFEHALRFLASPALEGSVVVYDRVYPRVYCSVERGFCRVCLGFNRGVKKAVFAYLSADTLERVRLLRGGGFIVGVLSATWRSMAS